MTEQDTELPTLPKGWIWVKVGEIIESVKGKKPNNLTAMNGAQSIPYINIEAFEKKIIRQFTNEKQLPMCEAKDVLIVWDGARCGLVGTGATGVIGSTLAKLKIKEIRNAYLFYFMKTKFQYINQRPRGVGIPHVEPTLFWEIPFPPPPLPEQHRIVNKIEELFTRLDDGVAEMKKVQLQLKRYRQSVLKAAFNGSLTAKWREEHKAELEPASDLLEGIKIERKKSGKYKELAPLDTTDLLELPEGWIWTSVGEIVEVGTGATPLKSEKRYYHHGTIPWVTSGSLSEYLTYKCNDFITELALKETNAKIFPAHTLLVAMYGEGKTRGKVSELAIPAATNQACAALIFTEKIECLRPFIKWFFKKNYDDIRRLSSGGVQPNLNLSIIKSTLFPMPSITEQQQIVEEIERCFSVADEIEENIKHSLIQAERLRQSILKKAFEGRLVPQDSDDEPADKLLERIKAEKVKINMNSKRGRAVNVR